MKTPWPDRVLVLEGTPDRALFTAEELATADEFKLPKRRDEWLLCRAAAKRLAVQLGIANDPRDVRVERPFRTDELSRMILTTGDQRETLPFPAAPPFSGEIADMEAAALDGQPPRVALAESRRTISTLVALYDSARRGVPLQLEHSAAL